MSTSLGGSDVGEPDPADPGFALANLITGSNPRWVGYALESGRRVIPSTIATWGRAISSTIPPPILPVVWSVTRPICSIASRSPRAGRDGFYSWARAIAAFLFSRSPIQPCARADLGGLGRASSSRDGLPAGNRRGRWRRLRLESLTDPTQRMFRAFADRTGRDRRRLSACLRGSRPDDRRGGGFAHRRSRTGRVGTRVRNRRRRRNDWPRCFPDCEALDLEDSRRGSPPAVGTGLYGGFAVFWSGGVSAHAVLLDVRGDPRLSSIPDHSGARRATFLAVCELRRVAANYSCLSATFAPVSRVPSLAPRKVLRWSSGRARPTLSSSASRCSPTPPRSGRRNRTPAARALIEHQLDSFRIRPSTETRRPLRACVARIKAIFADSETFIAMSAGLTRRSIVHPHRRIRGFAPKMATNPQSLTIVTRQQWSGMRFINLDASRTGRGR